MPKLSQCQACGQHVLQPKSACPFCESPAAVRGAVAPRGLVKGVALAGALAAASAAMVGCGDSSTPTDGGTGTDVGGMDSGTDAGTGDTGGVDTGGVDTGIGDTGPADTGTDNVALPPYGIPPDE